MLRSRPCTVQQGAFCHPLSDRCAYCLKVFPSKLERHMKTCRMKDDDIRRLEMQLNKQYAPTDSNVCRFCKAAFSKSCHAKRHMALCRERDAYRELLVMSCQTVSDAVHPLGKEDLRHIDMHRIVDMVVFHKSDVENKTVYVVAGTLVVEFHKMLREAPQNRNIIVKHERRQTALVKRDVAFEKDDTDTILAESFKNTARHLYNTLANLERQQPAPFRLDTRAIHEKIGDLVRFGLGLGKLKDGETIRRKFKLANVGVDVIL